MRTARRGPSRCVTGLFAVSALGALLGSPAARGAFVISEEIIPGPVNYGGGSGPQGAGETEFVLFAINDGVNGTGTTLLGVDATIQTSEPMVIDVINGSADVTGARARQFYASRKQVPVPAPAIPTFGVYNSSTDPDNGFAGTMVGVGLPDPGQPDDLAYADTAFTATTVQLGANVGTSNTDNYDALTGPVSPGFFSGDVTSMRIVGAYASSTNKGPAANLTAIPFANIVVPSGTTGVVFGALAGNQGAVASFSISLPEPSSLAVILLGGLGIMRRRNRRPA